jgi:hypothetical protein
VGDDSYVLFWKDFWHGKETFCNKFPRLFSFVLDEDNSVAKFANSEDLGSCFALPLSVEAFQEYQQISSVIAETHLESGTIDRRSFVWGSNYTPSKFYKFMFAHLPRDAALNAIWRSKAMPKLKVFSWLLMVYRLNTRDIMLRKHWQLETGPSCVLCHDAVLETRDHLFFECSFAQQCWHHFDIQWDLSLCEILTSSFRFYWAFLHGDICLFGLEHLEAAE